MWRRRRSAIFIDFENIPTKVSPASVAALLAWLEDGKFDEPGGRRKLMCKRIYWNSSAERHRAAFEAAGFTAVLCEKFSSMKNGADIRMALDIAETCWTDPRIEEYILFTTDSDFVPVLQRLSEKSKSSVVLVNEARMDQHTAYKIFADVLVPTRCLKEAATYERPRTGLFGRPRPAAARVPQPATGAVKAGSVAARSAPTEAVGAVSATGKTGVATTVPAAVATTIPTTRLTTRPTTVGTAIGGGNVANGTDHPLSPNVAPADPIAAAEAGPDDAFAQAERAVIRLGSRAPKTHIARKTIERQLQSIEGFTKSGASAYFGRQHYQGLMLDIGRRNSRIVVRQGKNLSATVMYVPENG